MNIQLIRAEFTCRKWGGFNNSITSGNRTMAMEFLTNAWRSPSEVNHCKVNVRGREVYYSIPEINRVFNLFVPPVCTLQHKRENSKSLSVQQREALKSQLAIPNVEWLRPVRSGLNKHFKTKKLLDIPRILAEFWIHSV
ncbi:hypothetical protein A2U01_0031807, partial [Trifolium medium]|nr:hypothetical protein [Trifolium medium]